MDAIVFPPGTPMQEAARRASTAGLHLYLTRGGTFVAARKRKPNWISVAVRVIDRDPHDQVDAESWLSTPGDFGPEAA